MQISGSFRIEFLLECNSTQFHKEPFIRWTQSRSCEEDLASVLQSAEPRQRGSQVKVELSGRYRDGMSQVHNFLPTFLGKKFLGAGTFVVGRKRLSYSGRTTDQQNKNSSDWD